jgi:hypothetical protein
MAFAQSSANSWQVIAGDGGSVGVGDGGPTTAVWVGDVAAADGAELIGSVFAQAARLSARRRAVNARFIRSASSPPADDRADDNVSQETGRRHRKVSANVIRLTFSALS